MNLALTIAILGASVSVVGWVVTHVLAASAERRRQRLLSQLEYTKQQLEELYGPLAFLMLEGLQTVDDLLSVLNRNRFFEADEIPPEHELKIWLFWVENDFFPRNQKIRELLASKTHLIEGEELPKTYLAFLEHYNSWRIRHERWQKEGIEYGWRSKIIFPDGFNDEVMSTFTKLKKRHAILIGMIAENENLLRSFLRWFHRENHKLKLKAGNGGP